MPMTRAVCWKGYGEGPGKGGSTCCCKKNTSQESRGEKGAFNGPCRTRHKESSVEEGATDSKERSKDGSHFGANLAGCSCIGGRTDTATRRYRQATTQRQVDWQECCVDQAIQEISGSI